MAILIPWGALLAARARAYHPAKGDSKVIRGGCALSKLYDYCIKIQDHIDSQGLDVFRTRGALAMRCGFLITLVHENEPDDPQRLAALEKAAQEVLGIHLH